MRAIKGIVVHCSATAGGKPFRAVDIDRWHRAQGWDSIGYHFVIPLDGSIEPGRPMEDVGAHVSGHNVNTIGICLIGGIGADGKPGATYSARQYLALELLLAGLRARWPTARIMGHRDFPGVAKACPSFDVASWASGRGIVPNPANWVP